MLSSHLLLSTAVMSCWFWICRSWAVLEHTQTDFIAPGLRGVCEMSLEEKDFLETEKESVVVELEKADGP